MIGAATMIDGVILQVSSVAGHVPIAQFCIDRAITGVGNGMNNFHDSYVSGRMFQVAQPWSAHLY